ncbi:MAG TPA: protocatechuate 3,4-dioxygenase subunit alpha [Ktedonobacteraceae bacterium]
MSSLPLTGSQTVGPFFSLGLLYPAAQRNVLANPQTAGERIRVEGRVLDGAGVPVPDAMVEIWQANAHGRYNHPADQSEAPLDPDFTGSGRSGTDEEGRYWFDTIKPGRVAFNDQIKQAPHLTVTIFARGLLNHLVTRVYFVDEPSNVEDVTLQCVPEARRATLLAHRETREGVTVYRFDIVLQGVNETAFFNV